MDLASRGGSRKPRSCRRSRPCRIGFDLHICTCPSNSSSAFCNQLFVPKASRASNKPRIYAHATVTIVPWSSPQISTRLVRCAYLDISDLVRSLALSDPRRSTLECANAAAPPFSHRRRSLTSSYTNNPTIESPNFSFVTITIFITSTNSCEWSCLQAAEGLLPPLQQIARHLLPAMSLPPNPNQLLIHRVLPSTMRLCR